MCLNPIAHPATLPNDDQPNRQACPVSDESFVDLLDAIGPLSAVRACRTSLCLRRSLDNFAEDIIEAQPCGPNTHVMIRQLVRGEVFPLSLEQSLLINSAITHLADVHGIEPVVEALREALR